ncbi:fimbrial protein [Erwinia sp. 9145]|uniref:fimbrial protein n=1 Tax=Erwinia sp. 9145 TaxID=1500895 RepID=UPI0005579A96|nr:fimbrial protein [Erwinia sp. 9145]
MSHTLRSASFFLLLLATVYCQPGLAETCNASVGQMTLNTQNIRYQPTLPVNTQMTNSLSVNGDGIHFTCDLQAPVDTVKRIIYQQMDTSGAGLVINGHHVYASKLEGIGYSLGFQCAGGAIRYIDDIGSPAGSESATVCESSQIPDMLTQRELMVKIYITFYKTGELALAGGNHINAPAQPQIGKLYIDQGAGNAAGASTTLDLAALNVDIGASGSCQVTTSTINVNLGPVSKAEFQGKNTRAGAARDFAIPVFCSMPTDIRIGFFGVAADPDFTDTLALSDVTGAAKGVGVRLSYGNNTVPAPAPGTAVKINEASNLPVLKHVVAGSAGSAENINFVAQFVQTENTVSAGTANTMATFSLIYN